jgi:hypothetical protein
VCGSIEPEPAEGRPQVTVQTSALVDDFGAMYFEVHDEEISFYFGKNDDSIHIGFTDQSLLNLARLVNRAVKATVEARAIAIPGHVNDVPNSNG